MKPRVLITGGSGLFAANCAIQLRDSHAVILGMNNRIIRVAGVETAEMKLDSDAGSQRVVEEINPDLVIHAAAATSVEWCESHPEAAGRINVDAAKRIALACTKFGKKLIHLSTDHLFQGTSSSHTEDDLPCPVNVYGQTKAVAETEVLAACSQALIVRTNFFGWGTAYRRSGSDAILDPLLAGKQLRLFKDVFFTPIIIESLVSAMLSLSRSGYFGVFNIVGDERVSKYEFGVRLCEVFGLDKKLIVPINLVDRADLVRRPNDMSLSNVKATQKLGYSLGDVTTNLRTLEQQERRGIREEMYAIA